MEKQGLFSPSHCQVFYDTDTPAAQYRVWLAFCKRLGLSVDIPASPQVTYMSLPEKWGIHQSLEGSNTF